MWFKKNKYNVLENTINNLNKTFEESNFIELSYLIGNKKEIVKRNLLAGISRGVGIGIGVTLITAILVAILQKIVTLNIPVIGKFVSDIIDIVKANRI